MAEHVADVRPPLTEPFLQDPDVTLYNGDALEVLRELPDASVDCCITSPPYWGLRDYGTGTWEGGDEDCEHQHETRHQIQGATSARSGRLNIEAQRNETFRDVCGKCGARRIDNQLGLEPTPDLYVARMVEVFREVRRVLAGHGTCWVNMGDGYAAGQGGRQSAAGEMPLVHREDRIEPGPRLDLRNPPSGWAERQMTRRTYPARDTGLKPKDLVGMPWRLAFALQADGWYLRADIIWAKPNPMPESVTDRPTKSHEYVFLLTKSPRYWFDQQAVRERADEITRRAATFRNGGPYTGGRSFANSADNAKDSHGDGDSSIGRNIRSVWEIATQPYPEAHFATYPEELVRRCLLAGCPEWVCRECGKPRERIVDVPSYGDWHGRKGTADELGKGQVGKPIPGDYHRTHIGWSDCGHGNYRPGVVLDPFVGSGTTALVARNHGRHAIGIDLRADYLELAARRLQQLSLLAETR